MPSSFKKVAVAHRLVQITAAPLLIQTVGKHLQYQIAMTHLMVQIAGTHLQYSINLAGHCRPADKKLSQRYM
jgi:hypothetical protein